MRTNPSELAEIFDAELRESEAETLYELGPRYNVAPTQDIPVIVQREDEDQDGDGGLWRFPYSIDPATNLVTLGEPTRVETEPSQKRVPSDWATHGIFPKATG